MVSSAWFVKKYALLDCTTQAEIAQRAGCSRQYVHEVFSALIRNGLARKERKNLTKITRPKKLLFALASIWKMPQPLRLNVPLETRAELSDFLNRLGLAHAFTLNGLHVWVDDDSKLRRFAGKGNVFVYRNAQVVKSYGMDGYVDVVQHFCDFFSNDVEKALNFAKQKALINTHNY